MSDSTAANKTHSFNPATVPLPPPTYKQVAITPLLTSSRLITVAGQTGIDPATGKVISEKIRDQAKQAYQSVLNCLTAAAATPRDIVFVRHYIVKDTGNPDVDRLDVVDRGWGDVWMEFMDRQADGHRPPDTVVGVASLAQKQLLYEVEVWATIHKG